MNKAIYFFLLIISTGFTFISCDKKDDPKPIVNNNINNNDEYGFPKLQVLVDGSLITARDDSAGIIWNALTTNKLLYSSSLVVKESDKAIIDIENAFFSSDGEELSEEEFKDFFHIGSHVYSNKYGEDGITISYFDQNNLNWNTYGDQTGSNFIISEVTDEENWFFGKIWRVKATFNCKVYNGSESKTLTNGVYWGYFIK